MFYKAMRTLTQGIFKHYVVCLGVIQFVIIIVVIRNIVIIIVDA